MEVIYLTNFGLCPALCRRVCSVGGWRHEHTLASVLPLELLDVFMFRSLGPRRASPQVKVSGQIKDYCNVLIMDITLQQFDLVTNFTSFILTVACRGNCK